MSDFQKLETFNVFQPVYLGRVKDNSISCVMSIDEINQRIRHDNILYEKTYTNDIIQWYYYIHDQPEELGIDYSLQKQMDDADNQLPVDPMEQRYSQERLTRNLNNLIDFATIVDQEIVWWLKNERPSDPIDADNHDDKVNDFENRKIDSYAKRLIVLIDSIIDNDRFTKESFGNYKILQKAINNSSDVSYKVDKLDKLNSIAFSVVAPRIEYEGIQTIERTIASPMRPMEA